jgi:hypothetical protein
MGYMDDHPTQFNWTEPVKARVKAIQDKFPWRTYANTYWDHPPGNGRWPVNYYTRYSIDFWGGGGANKETYTGYRGKTLLRDLGDKIFDELFYAESGPAIDWIIWRGRMWWSPKTGGPGWTSSPPGPADSDPDHFRHIHVTYQRNE